MKGCLNSHGHQRNLWCQALGHARRCMQRKSQPNLLSGIPIYAVAQQERPRRMSSINFKSLMRVVKLLGETEVVKNRPRVK